MDGRPVKAHAAAREFEDLAVTDQNGVFVVEGDELLEVIPEDLARGTSAADLIALHIFEPALFRADRFGHHCRGLPREIDMQSHHGRRKGNAVKAAKVVVSNQPSAPEKVSIAVHVFGQ